MLFDAVEKVLSGILLYCVAFGLTDDVPLKYSVTIREIYTTVKKAEISLIDGH